MKRVLFLILHETMPSSRVRVTMLLRDLAEQGIAGAVRVYPRRLSAKLRMFREIRRHDIVFIQKKLPAPADLLLFKLARRRMVFDFDDAIYCRHNSSKGEASRLRGWKFANMVRQADLVVAGNRILAERARPLNRNVAILPSAVETRGAVVNAHAAKPGPCVIGWVGGEGNLGYLALLIPVLQRLARSHDIQLRVVCSRGIDIPGVAVRFIPWTLAGEQAEVAQFDIGVMPLSASEHAAGKCGYKALLYMAAGVPPVVSDVGINGDIVRHGEEGFVARAIDDYYGWLDRLVRDPALRRRMGAKARVRAEQDYSVPVIARRLAERLITLCASGRPPGKDDA